MRGGYVRRGVRSLRANRVEGKQKGGQKQQQKKKKKKRKKTHNKQQQQQQPPSTSPHSPCALHQM